MFNDRFAQLIARQFSGESSPEEDRELESFLQQHPEAFCFFEGLREYWKLEPRPVADDIQEEIHFQQIIAIAEKEPEEQPVVVVPVETLPGYREARVFNIKKLIVAASILVVAAASWWLIKSRNDAPSLNPIALNEIVAKSGARTYLLLPDGSKVWLNSESRIEYQGNFNDTIREVNLEGEAFFEVVNDKTRPFIVHTSDIDIKVLGTAFNVKSYPKETSIEATLIHGLIEVTNKKEPTSPKVILRPHEKLVFSKVVNLPQEAVSVENKSMSFHKPFSITALPKNIADTSVAEISWVYDKLVFDGETFREIARKMERWYNVTIRFKTDKVANIPIHVEFKDETIVEALKALQLIEPFAYTINGKEIEILKK